MSSKGVRFFGYFWSTMYIFAILGAFTGAELPENTSLISFCIMSTVIFLLPGLYCIKKGKALVLIENHKEMIINIVANGHDTTMAGMANILNINEEDVMKITKKMIDKGELQNVRLDIIDRKIVILQPAQEPVQLRKVKCNQCGANTTVQGEKGTCEYCGSPIE